MKPFCIGLLVAGPFAISTAYGDTLYRMRVQFEHVIFANSETIVYAEIRDQRSWPYITICNDKRTSRDLIETLQRAESKIVHLSIRSKSGLAKSDDANPMDPQGNLCIANAEIEIDEIQK